MELAKLTTRQVDALSRDLPVIIPVAAVEQHGPHLPLFTDSLLLGEVVRRAQLACADDGLFLPLMWLGNSHHHLDFAGTLSGDPRLWIDLMSGLVENMLTHGFKRLLVINGHGGNCVPVNQALFELKQTHRNETDLLLLGATYWTLGEKSKSVSNPASKPVSKPRDQLLQTQMGHACEWETSMVLQIDPESVGEYQTLPDVSMEGSFEPSVRAWVTQERSEAGYIGYPRAASANKGEFLLNRFSEGLVNLIKEVKQWDGKSWATPSRS